jgi:nucleoside-diphosphate-sugar epimerase
VSNSVERRSALKDNEIAWFERMLEIREFEKQTNLLFASGAIRGTTHLCVGQEALAVGIASVLNKDDVVAATIAGIEKDEANGEIFNVGLGEAIDVLTVANTLIKAYGSNSKITVSNNYRLGDIRHNYADLTKIKTKLGFLPTVSFEQGIAKFTAWVDTQVVVEDNYERSIEEMKAKGLYK